jgi:hypothetical protein
VKKEEKNETKIALYSSSLEADSGMKMLIEVGFLLTNNFYMAGDQDIE